jgi:hypothetical protein
MTVIGVTVGGAVHARSPGADHPPARRRVAIIVAAGLTVPAPAGAAGTTGATEKYLVLFKGSSSPADAAAIVTRAGGTVVANYARYRTGGGADGRGALDVARGALGGVRR